MLGRIRQLLYRSSSQAQASCDNSGPYVGGRVQRTNRDWQPLNYSGDAAIRDSWELLTARVRDLVRNDAVLAKALNQLVTLVVGSGIQTFSCPKLPDGTYDEEFADESDEWFGRWSELECDAEGSKSFQEMQRLSFSEMVQVGNSFWLEVLNSDKNRTSPLSYQLLEWEQLDRTMDTERAWIALGKPSRGHRPNRVVNGIELNAFNVPVAYWLYDVHPYDSWSQPGGSSGVLSKRIPASRVIHNYLPDRISSHVGVSWFSSLVQVSRDRDRYLANELTASALASLLTLVVKRNRPNGGIGSALAAESGDNSQATAVQMGHPFIAEIGVDESVEVAESKRPNRNASDFLKTLHVHTAMGAKMSVNRLLGDPAEANFGSIKSSHLDDERMVSPIQQHQAQRVAIVVRRRHNELAATMGRYSSVSPRLFDSNRWRYQAFDWIGSGDPDLQPKEEGDAAIDRLRSGRTTYQYEVGRLGFHWRKQLRQTKQFLDALDALNLKMPDWSKGAGGNYLPWIGVPEEFTSSRTGSAERGGRATQ